MKSESLTERPDTTKGSEADFGVQFLTSTLAHEIRNPLQAIRLQLEQVASGGNVTPVIGKISENLARVESVLERMQKLNTRFEAHMQMTNLRSLLADVLQAASFWLSAAGINVRLNTRWEGEPFCECDPELVQQILLNLIMNAIQAMPQGGTLTLNLNETLDFAEIEVADTGVGVSAETLKLIGTPFFTTKPNGNGIGLAFCRSVAALHGGNLDIESEVGRGTLVRVTLRKWSREENHV